MKALFFCSHNWHLASLFPRRLKIKAKIPLPRLCPASSAARFSTSFGDSRHQEGGHKLARVTMRSPSRSETGVLESGKRGGGGVLRTPSQNTAPNKMINGHTIHPPYGPLHWGRPLSRGQQLITLRPADAGGSPRSLGPPRSRGIRLCPPRPGLPMHRREAQAGGAPRWCIVWPLTHGITGLYVACRGISREEPGARMSLQFRDF